MKYLLHLPNEIINNILYFCDPIDKYVMMRVNIFFHEFLNFSLKKFSNCINDNLKTMFISNQIDLIKILFNFYTASHIVNEMNVLIGCEHLYGMFMSTTFIVDTNSYQTIFMRLILSQELNIIDIKFYDKKVMHRMIRTFDYYKGCNKYRY